MPCPFLADGRPAQCVAGQTTYTPQEREARAACMDRPAENYLFCKRYRHAVWSGLAPTIPAPQKSGGKK